VGDPNAPRLQAVELIRVLDRHEVDYVLVGGLAAMIHGATRLTTDMDVVPEWSHSNRERLARAFVELNAQLRIDDQTVAFPISASTFNNFELSTWRTDLGDVDIITGIPTATHGVYNRYEQLAEHATKRELEGGMRILVGHLDDIIESKLALSRPSDLAAMGELLNIQRERNTAR
jgi:molybdenum cofactor biosynthesis enzyme MoaA